MSVRSDQGEITISSPKEEQLFKVHLVQGESGTLYRCSSWAEAKRVKMILELIPKMCSDI